MQKFMSNAIAFLLIVGGVTSIAPPAFADGDRAVKVSSDGAKPKSRRFDFTYAARVKQLPVGANVRVWLPVPQSNEDQTIERVDSSLPLNPSMAAEPGFGNKVLYFAAKSPQSGELDFSVTYRVTRSEVLGLITKTGVALSDAQRKQFLAAESKVPIDGKPLDLLAGLNLPKDNPLKLGELLYNKVDEHMRYDKSQPGYGRGDAVWACDSRSGNCTDFHSLFISLSRSQGVPARFEIGFPLPEEPGEGEIGGYHCWASFYVDGHGWVPVDISEADKNPDLKQYYFGNLTENRVTFTVGRDVTLVPKQDGEPLNYFIYPHVEVNGELWPGELVDKRFKFKDI